MPACSFSSSCIVSLKTVTVICLGLRILSSLAHLPSLRRRFHFAPLNQEREEDEEQLWDEEAGGGGGGGRGARLKTLMRKQRTNAEVDGDRKGFVVLRASLLLLLRRRRSAPASAEPTNERFQRALENLETSAPLQPPSFPHPPSHPSLLLRSLSFSVSCLNAGCTSQIHHLSVKRLGCVNSELVPIANHPLYPLL